VKYIETSSLWTR